MIDEKQLQTYLLNFEEENRTIIWDFMYFADNLYEFRKNTQRTALRIMKNFLDCDLIKNLTYELIIKKYSDFHSKYKKHIEKFIYYLCYKNIISECPLYRVFDLKDKVFSSEEFLNFKYWIELDEKYYQLFLKSPLYALTSQDKYKILSFHMNKEECKDTHLYNLLNDYFENLKVTSNYSFSHLYSILGNIKKVFQDFTNFSNEDFNNPDNIFIFISNTGIPKPIIFFTLDILKINGYITNSLINDTVAILKNLKVKRISNYAYKIFESGIPSLWYEISKGKLVFINCSDSYKRNILLEFAYKYSSYYFELSFFLKEFDNSLEIPKAPLSFYTFLEQIKFFNNHINLKTYDSKSSVLNVLQIFYTFYQSYETNVFIKDGYSPALLNSVDIVQYIVKGYEVVNHNPIDNIPISDKWIFCYKDTDTSSIIKIYRIDFSIVNNSIFKNWLKYYLWHKNQKMSSKLRNFNIIYRVLNYIHDLKLGKEYSIFCIEENKDFENINIQEIRAVKSYLLNNRHNNLSQVAELYTIRSFFNYLSQNNIHSFEPGIFIELSSSRTLTYSQSPIPEEHLKLIINKISDLSKDDKINQLYQIIFYLLLETEFRISQILNLNINCIKKTAKDNEYVIYSETKTSNQEEVSQPISKYVKSCIDEAINLTKHFRNNCNYKDFKQKLFIIPYTKKKVYKIITKADFLNFMYKICNELSIPTYNSKNLRDTRMTNAEMYVAKKNLSDVQLNILSGHKSTSTTLQYYSKPSIADILEAANGVIIGNIDIKGDIRRNISSDVESNENLVSNKCGYCSSNTCTCFSNLDCILCKYFVTTISRKPYFEEQIKILDYKISQAIFEHDVEDLVNQKRVLLGYLNKIISLKENLENE